MTANRNLKQRVRARALKTGESYTAARHQLAGAPRSMTVAAAQLPLLPDPGDAGQIRASGTAVRALMRQASTRGARLVHFPEGALTTPAKGVMSSTGPDDIGPADWDRADWPGLTRELDEITRLAGRLRLWTVAGGIHRPDAGARPVNCLFVISSRGRLTGRYDERMLSKTKSTFMYTAGRDPLVFTASGVRFGCALGMETHYPELFAAYEEQDVDCVLFSTHGNPETPGIFAVEAAGHAAANSLWVSYAGPAAGDAPPAGLVAPDGTWAVRCAPGVPGLAVTDVTTSTDSPARAWRRTARTTFRD
jgi:predicted amidohydrolase